eukprot:2242466-Alexandrium_andersonii.AAC.1
MCIRDSSNANLSSEVCGAVYEAVEKHLDALSAVPALKRARAQNGLNCVGVVGALRAEGDGWHDVLQDA